MSTMHLCATGCGKPATTTICRDCTTELVTNLRALATGGVYRIRIHQKHVHTPAVRDKDGEIITPARTQLVQEFRTDSRPSLYELLIDTLTRRDHTGSDSIGAVSGVSSFEISFHKAASALKREIDRETLLWAREIAQLNGRQLEARSVRAAAAWLASQPQLLAAHEYAEVLHATIGRFVRKLHRIIDRDPDQVYLGQCGNVLDQDADVVCEQDLYIPPGIAVIQCPACKHIWDVPVRREVLLDHVDDQLATPPEISKALSRMGEPVTESMIYGYVHRGRLNPHPPHPLDPRKRVRYRIGDVRAIRTTLKKGNA